MRPLFALLIAACSLTHASATVSVLGKLGQATASTRIYASPNTRSRVFYRVKPFEYLVVRDSNDSRWISVLLQTGVYGYAPKKDVAELPYQVTTSQSRRASPALTSRTGSALASYSLNFLGTPYKWGGNDEYSGIDCSGFVKKLYGKVGVDLPRTADEQSRVGQPITDLAYLQPGDRLYFWEAKRGRIGHTGMYLGNGYFVHSSMGHKGVATDYLDTPKWRKILVAARR